MAELLIHWIVPLALLFAVFPKLDKRMVLLLFPLAFFQDLDHLVSARSLFYNVFLFAFVLIAVYFLSKKNKAVVLIAFFFLSSHLLLDLGYPGFAPLYPLSGGRISVDYMLYSVNAGNHLGEIRSYFLVDQLPPNVFDQGQVSVLLSNQTVAISLLALSLLFARWYSGRK